jgi:hypothetical protein
MSPTPQHTDRAQSDPRNETTVQPRQSSSPKGAYVARSVRACFTARILLFVLSSAIDFAPMSDLMNYNHLFSVKNLVNDAVVTNAELVQSRKVAFIRFWSDVIEIRGEPIDTLGDSASNRFVQSL